jgi:hypothetical protein
MFYILRHFEKTAVHFDTTILVVSGLVAFLLGLVTWLGGTAFRKFLAIIAGAAIGYVIGLLIAGGNTVPVITFTCLAAALAAVLEKFFTAILAALLAAVIGFAFLAGPHLAENPGTITTVLQNAQNHPGPLDTDQTIEVVKEYAAILFAEIRHISSQMTTFTPVVIAGIAAVVLIMGFFFGRLITALSAATLGTILVFAGMILLLLYKGTEPISHISSKQPFYATVFTAMTAFGTIGQFLLYRRPAKKEIPAAKKEPDNRKAAEAASYNWRSI